MSLDVRPGARPIFVVGAPRSGTTLLRYVLCSHPRIYIPPESNFIPRFFGRQPCERMSRDRAARVVDSLSDYGPFWRDWQGPRPDPREFVDALSETTPAALLSELYGRYAAQHGATRWGDKTPAYAAHLDLVLTLFPAAQIIHVIRDVRDVTRSSLDAYRGLRFFYVDAYYVSRSWRERVGRAREIGRTLRDDQYREVRYEHLTADLDRSVHEVCDFLGETFDSRMTTPEQEAEKHHHSRGIHGRVRDPVSHVSVGRWREGLDPGDQWIVQHTAHDLLAALDYPIGTAVSPSVPQRARHMGLRAKYAMLDAGRRALTSTGFANPTRLLRSLPRSKASRDRLVSTGQIHRATGVPTP